MPSVQEKLEFAQKHLRKALEAWDPVDWADLSMYGFYCLEAAVDAAALAHNVESESQHWARVDAARKLADNFGLPDIADLLRDLNEIRKSEAYGDVQVSYLDPQDVATALERYVEEVENQIKCA